MIDAAPALAERVPIHWCGTFTEGTTRPKRPVSGTRRVPRLGWLHDFRDRSWAELLNFHPPIWAKVPEGEYVVAIIENVIASCGADRTSDACAVATNAGQ